MQEPTQPHKGSEYLINMVRQSTDISVVFTNVELDLESLIVFMQEGGQLNDDSLLDNPQVKQLRCDMLREEVNELAEATTQSSVFDAGLDIIVLAFGALFQAGYSPREIAFGFKQVMQSNLAKRFPDGIFHKNEAGKIIKPEGWKHPDLYGSDLVTFPNVLSDEHS